MDRRGVREGEELAVAIDQLRLVSDERERWSPDTPEYDVARELEERLNAAVLEMLRRRNKTALTDG